MSLRRSDRPSPREERFRMPAEWESHAATWLVWPHNRADWEVKSSAVEWVYVDIVRRLIEGERVALVYRTAAVRRRAERRLLRSGVALDRIDPYVMPTNRSWIRDSGPIFVVRGPAGQREVAATDWGFTAWARYRAWRHDNALPRRIANRLGMRRFPIQRRGSGGRPRPVVLEGGSVDVNGQGDLLTTEECLLGAVQPRNPAMGRDALEATLREGLGVRRIHWLGGGIVGDDTHGHVDDVARFVGRDTIVTAVERDRDDVNHRPLAENLTRLQRLRGRGGRPFDVVPMPMPRPVVFDGERLPATYLNFYVANAAVLVPTFNDPADRDALSILASVFPTREVVGIHAGDLILGLGALHCLTQPQPRGVAAAPVTD